MEGLTHRYPEKVLFKVTSICPTYCAYCTRAHGVGPHTETVSKKHQKPSRKRWGAVYDYIETHTQITDVVVSGGDLYMLMPRDIREIADRLLSMPHIKRIRFASKGLAVNPARIIDPTDAWADTLIEISNEARQKGTHVCFHTHFQHPNEITWVTRAAARKLFANGVIVRNQSVLLRGVNDSIETMGKLMRELADMNVQPVSQCSCFALHYCITDVFCYVHYPGRVSYASFTKLYHVYVYLWANFFNSTTSTSAISCKGPSISVHLCGRV